MIYGAAFTFPAYVPGTRLMGQVMCAPRATETLLQPGPWPLLSIMPL